MFKHIAWAMQAPAPDALSRWLLVILADHANDEDICWPSQATLATRSGMGRSTINKKLLLLEERNLISRIKGGTGKSTTYRLRYVSVGDMPVSRRETSHVSERDTKLPVKLNTLEEWQPSEELLVKLNALIDKHGAEIDHDIETTKFIAHHISVGTKFRNIEMGYRKWIANAISFGSKQSTRSTNRPNKKHSTGESQSDKFRQLIDSAKH